MTSGIGLDTAFNQDEPTQNINTHPKKVKPAESFKKSDDLERLQHTKVGDTVGYTSGSGVVVSKEGSYLTVYNKESNAYDRMRAGETHIPGDTIGCGITTQLWDQMNHETRMASLHKSGIQEPLHFIDRKWSELPMNLKDVLKLSPSSVSVGYGVKNPPVGATQDSKPMSAKEVKDTKRLASATQPSGQSRTFTPGGKKPTPKENKGPESKRKPAGANSGSAADAAAARSTGGKKPGVTFAQGLDKATNYGDLATEIYKMRNQLEKDATSKSDVEHGATGGVVTDTPFDAPDDYEEKRPKVDGKEFDHNHQQKTPKDIKDGAEKIKDGGAISTGTEGAYNAKYDPDEDGYREKALINKYNTRYGPRKATKEDIERLMK